jgi:hypothetical protein
MQAWQGPDGSGTPNAVPGGRKDNSFGEIQLSGVNKTYIGIQESAQVGDGRITQGRLGNANQSQGAAGRHLTNKSDTNLISAKQHGKREQSEGKKKRKNSDKVSW